MRSGNKVILVATLAVLPLAGCGMFDGRADGRPPARAGAPAGGDARPGEAAAPSDANRLIGAPYSIDGQVYTPADVARYDEIGYAAVLWDTAEGRRTATGEAYLPGAIAAAHRTLPLPSYVEVTSIATGKTIVVRVNDRGPMLSDRIIALTPGAARQLGIAMDGTAGVRVRLVNPLEQERATLRGGGRVPERLEIPPALRTAMARRLPPAPAPLTGPVRTAAVVDAAAVPDVPAPAPVPAAPPVATVDIPPATPQPAPPQLATVPVDEAEALPPLAPPASHAPPPAPEGRTAPPHPATRAPAAPPPPQAASGGFVVQVAALSTRARADALAQRVGGFVTPAGALFRVRTGPYATEAAARDALRQIHAKGYADARMMTNDAR